MSVARHPVITDVGDYIFMLPFGDNTQAAATAEFTYTKKGWKTATMLMDTEWDYTKFLSKYFIARYTELGGKMLLEDTYKSGDKDFSAQLTKIKNLQPQPDFVFVSAIPDDIGTLIKQARDQGVTLPIVGGDGYDTPLLTEVAGPERSANVFFSTHLGVYGDDPTAAKFRDAFKKEYGQEAQSVFAALGYDGVNLVADGIKRAGSADHKAIRDALAVTKGWKGASGEITYPPGIRIPSKSVALDRGQGRQVQPAECRRPGEDPGPLVRSSLSLWERAGVRGTHSLAQRRRLGTGAGSRNASSLKHQPQSSPGSNDCMIGSPVV